VEKLHLRVSAIDVLPDTFLQLFTFKVLEPLGFGVLRKRIVVGQVN
jgi:hypothetical protein